eukprot:scaffold4049_cov100-Skeletonema_dohrnii-CCMP3373.AAC.8
MPLLPIISCHHHCSCMLRFDIIVLLVTFVVTAAASSVNEAITGVPMREKREMERIQSKEKEMGDGRIAR